MQHPASPAHSFSTFDSLCRFLFRARWRQALLVLFGLAFGTLAHPQAAYFSGAVSSGNLGTVSLGSTSSTAASILFTFDVGGTLGSKAVLTDGVPGLDFTDAGTGSCKAGKSYAGGASCSVNVAFTPVRPTTRHGAAVLYDGSGNPIATAYLQGTGAGPQAGFLPGTQTAVTTSSLNSPIGMAVDASGNVYLTDTGNNRVLKEPAQAGGCPETVVANSATNLLNYPFGVAVDGSGIVYIADYNNHRVLKMTPSGCGYSQSVLPTNGLAYPTWIAVDGSGNVYIDDPLYHRVLKETLSQGGYSQSTLVDRTSSGYPGFIPIGLGVDASGNVYVADGGDSTVFKETLSNGAYSLSTFGFVPSPTALTVDGNANVYVSTGDSNTVIKETPAGGSYTQSTVPSSGLNLPFGLAVDGGGNVYVVNQGVNQVLKEDFADPPSLAFASTPAGTTSSDSPMTVTVENAGNQALNFTGILYPADFPEAAGDANACTGSTSLAPGQQCDLPVDFAPDSVASLNESVTLTDNSLNAAGAMQSVAVGGTATSFLQTVSFAPPAQVAYGSAPIHLSSYASASSGLAVSYQLLGGPATLNGSILTITGAGMVMIQASQGGNSTYAPATPVEETITVVPALLKVTAYSYSRVYASALPSTYAYSVSGYVNGDTAANAFTGAPGFSTSAAVGSSAGTYPITPSIGSLSSGKYTFQFVAGTLTITPAVLKVTAFSYTRVYGTAPPSTFAYSVTGYLNGDTAATAFTGAPALTSTASVGSPAGSYPITPAIGALASVNYTFQFAPGTLSITPAVLKVTAFSYSRVYATALPASYAYSVSGYVNGDTASSSFTGAPAITTTASMGSPAGSYPITPGIGSLVSGNYTFQFAAGSLAITPAVLKVTAYSYTRVYDTALPSPFVYSIAGYVNGDTASSALSGAPAVTAAAHQGSPVGNYAITPSIGSLVSNNYTFQFAAGTLGITPAVLKVTAFSYSRVYAAALPSTFAYSVTGYVNGDTAASSLTGAPAVTTTAHQGSPSGNYPITPNIGSLASNNYTFQFAPGTLAITPAVLQVTAYSYTRVYATALPASFAYSVTGYLNGDTAATAFTGAPAIATAAKLGSPAAPYAITPSIGSLASANYTFQFAAGTLTITPAVLKVTAFNYTRAVGAALPNPFAYSVAGFVNGDTAANAVTGAPSITTTAVQGSPAGAYPITPANGSLSAANYTFTFVNGTLTITP
jgi:sugar lactone lactonase YvrE